MSIKIKLQCVHYMPKELKPGILYFSEKFSTAAHLCPCGCGSKIRTPLGPTEWQFEDTDKGPTLRPSVGNWQHPCQSHYWIYQGEIRWAEKWTSQQIAEGRRHEEERRRAYYDNLNQYNKGFLQKLWYWFKGLFN